jgi:hypothetical protein
MASQVLSGGRAMSRASALAPAPALAPESGVSLYTMRPTVYG